MPSCNFGMTYNVIAKYLVLAVKLKASKTFMLHSSLYCWLSCGFIHKCLEKYTLQDKLRNIITTPIEQKFHVFAFKQQKNALLMKLDGVTACSPAGG